MFPLRERRKSATAQPSHNNSQENSNSRKESSKVGNFLNSLRQESENQLQNNTYNKPFFKISNLESQDRSLVRDRV